MLPVYNETCWFSRAFSQNPENANPTKTFCCFAGNSRVCGPLSLSRELRNKSTSAVCRAVNSLCKWTKLTPLYMCIYIHIYIYISHQLTRLNIWDGSGPTHACWGPQTWQQTKKHAPRTAKCLAGPHMFIYIYIHIYIYVFYIFASVRPYTYAYLALNMVSAEGSEQHAETADFPQPTGLWNGLLDLAVMEGFLLWFLNYIYIFICIYI